MAELSDFQKAKFTQLFHRFYDSNKNGVVTHSDFKDILKSLQKLRKVSADDPKLAGAAAALHAAWNALKQGADTDHDAKVTMDEWMSYWAGFVAKSQGAFPEDEGWVKDYANFWFDLMDTSGDDIVDENEFAEVCGTFGATEADARAAFKKFGVKPVDREYYAELWLQYMTGDDKEQPGTFVFGHLDW